MTNQPNQPQSDPPRPLAPRTAPLAGALRAGGDEAVWPTDLRVNDEAESSTVSLAFFWYVARKHWRLAAPLGLLLAGMAMSVVWMLFEPMYRAEQLLQIRHETRPFLPDQPLDDSKLFVETQVELLRSRLILGRILAEGDVAAMPEIRREEDPRGWLGKHLEVRPSGKSELFTVAFTGPNRANAERIVDAIIEKYFELYNFESLRQSTLLLDVLEKEKARQMEEVQVLQTDVQRMAKSMAGGSSVILDSMGRTLVDLNPALNVLQQRLVDAQVEAELLKAKIKVREDSPAEASEPQGVADVDSHPQIAALREAIEADRFHLKTIRKDSDLYRQREQRILSGEARLKEARQEFQEQLAKYDAESAATARQQSLASLNEQLREYEERTKQLRERLDQERKQMEGRTGGSFQLEFRQSELLRAKEVTQRIEDRIFWLKIELAPSQRPERVVRLHPAAVADPTPIEAVPFKKLAMAGMLAMCLPFGLFGAWEHVSQRIYQPDQLRQESLLPLIGEVAVMPSRPLLPRPGHRRRYAQERAIFEESVESLRTALAVSDRLQGLQVLVVASAVSGEGKTSLASQLAVSFARGGSGPVLVIDADLRRPGLHDVFGVERGPGLAELLRGERQFADAVVDWGNDVHVLPAGELHRNPHRLFSGPDFADLLDGLRGDYRRIIVDVPPILSAGESLHLAKAADGVLLCVMKDHSRATLVKMAYERLVMAGANAVGAVLSGTSTHEYAYRYGDYSV